MREFDQFEKQVISKIKIFKEQGINLNFVSIFDDLFIDKSIGIEKKSKKAWINLDTKTFANYDKEINAWIPKLELVKEVGPTLDIIIKIVFLLNYLEKEGLIFLYNFSQNGITEFPTLSRPPEPIRIEISDEKVVEILIEYFQKEIIISQSIITLANNNFVSHDEIRHNQNLQKTIKSIKLATWALGMSIVIGLASILISAYSISSHQRTIDETN